MLNYGNNAFNLSCKGLCFVPCDRDGGEWRRRDRNRGRNRRVQQGFAVVVIVVVVDAAVVNVVVQHGAPVLNMS